MPRPSFSALRRAPRRGMVLIVVLLVLALLLLAGAGAMRAVDTSNVISGNFSFQQAAAQAADRALTDALNTAAAIAVGGNGNTPVNNRYFSTRQATDARGLPSTVNWDNVTCVDPNGATIANCALDSGDYRIQYVVERMCTSNPNFANVLDIRAKCEYEASSTAVTAATISIRYRVVMRVRGPRGTESWFEAMVTGPAST